MSDVLRLLPLIILLLSGGCGILVKTFQLAKYGAVVACVLFIMSSLSSDPTVAFSIFKIGKVDFGLSFYFGEVETIVCAVVSAILCCLYFARSIELIDKQVERKFGILNIFVFFMCMAVFSKNLFQFYVAVEAMGVISAMIVGLEKRATHQATRVFAFNKFASLLFLAALVIIACNAGSLEVVDIEALYAKGNANALLWPSALLVIACLCKGAQMPFSYWLVDAAKASVFASILIHSGTIVGIGIIFISKFHFMFSVFQPLQWAMVLSGICTSVLMACYATVHNNIKKIMACLTAASVGSMFVACGLGMYSLAMLGFLVHALFKATLFMVLAYLISVTAGEQNILRMGGIKSAAPRLNDVMWLAFMMAVGFPLLPGFFAKIPFMASIQLSNVPLLLTANVVGNIFATMAAFRLITIAMYGKSRMDDTTLSMVSRSSERDMRPIWLLMAISVFGSFVVWSMYGWGELHFGTAGVLHVRNIFDYFIENIEELCQIAVSIVIVLLLMRFSGTKWVKRTLSFMTVLNRSRVYQHFCDYTTRIVLCIMKVCDVINTTLDSAMYMRSYKLLRSTSIALSRAHPNLLAAHVVWIITGLLVVVVTVASR
ncbi:MAG: hypothetical protein LBR78_02025 [Holosporales bacterium]|jgi:NADH-quinone oxidoreductase subunit L|nr:hypothetical protein [Holosporales bacterium]